MSLAPCFATVNRADRDRIVIDAAALRPRNLFEEFGWTRSDRSRARRSISLSARIWRLWDSYFLNPDRAG